MAKQDRSADERFAALTDSTRRVLRRAREHHFKACAEIAAGCETGPEAAAAIIAELRRTLGDGPDSVEEKRCATLAEEA